MDILLVSVVVLGIALNIASVAWVIRKMLWMHLPNERARANVTVILPLTGHAPQLKELIRLLGLQTLLPRRLIISVESQDDPAYAAARAVMPLAAFPVEVVVAGAAAHQGQKCRNQQVALDYIDVNDEIIAMMDGDIRPHPTWLSGLVAPILYEDFHLVTGHRWQQVSAPRLGAHLVAAIDRGVTLTPRLDGLDTMTAWGGSMAISVESAAHMNLRGALDHTLSDDLTICRQAAESGLRVVTRGLLFVASPSDMGLIAAWRFARRQYQMCRIYRPQLWWMGLGIIGLRLSAWACAVALIAIHSPAGEWAVSALVTLSALSVLKQYLVGVLARWVGAPDPASVRFGQLVLAMVQPVTDAFHVSAILGAAWAGRVRWGHVTYEVEAPDRIRVRRRIPFSR